MKVKRLLMASTATLIFLLPWGVAQAFECPKHFTAAQAAIDKVTGDMGGDMSKQMPKEQMALVHALLDEAKMILAGAKHNHEKPTNQMRQSLSYIRQPSVPISLTTDTPGP